MAEALLRAKAGDRFNVRSAGVFAIDGGPAAREAVQVLSEKGIDDHHQSKKLDEALIRWADVILTMTESHKRTVGEQFPESAGKVYTLKEYADDDPKTAKKWEKLEACYAELETKRALEQNENIDLLEKEIRALEASLPSCDIPDPFGSSLDQYRTVCAEIEKYLDQLVKKEEGKD
jgi:protein-tyrosine phosphatase